MRDVHDVVLPSLVITFSQSVPSFEIYLQLQLSRIGNAVPTLIDLPIDSDVHAKLRPCRVLKINKIVVDVVACSSKILGKW